MTPELLDRSAAAISGETRTHHRQLALASKSVTAIGRRMDRLLYFAIPAAYGVIIVVGKLLERLLPPG